MTDNTSARKRGEQPGNTNALKHGFYSQQFRNGELADLDSFEDTNLQDEIGVLRVYLRRLLELADGIEDTRHAAAILDKVSLVTVRIATLAKAQRILSGDQDARVATALSEALQDVMKEMNLRI